MTHTLADGCCSAHTPCSHHCKDPTTICDTCRAASPSVSAWLAKQREDYAEALKSAANNTELLTWLRASRDAYAAAHAYAVARPDRAVSPMFTLEVPDADLAYLAGLAISSKDQTLARIAAALLLAR